MNSVYQATRDHFIKNTFTHKLQVLKKENIEKMLHFYTR